MGLLTLKTLEGVPMPEPNLILDRVTHVSLVDDPAVADSEFLVMKRAGEDGPEGFDEAMSIIKDGRSLSSANIDRLADIYTQIKGSHPRAAKALVEFLRETSHDSQDVESILEEKGNMSDTDISELVEAVEKSNEQVAKATEAASEAAEAATQAAEAAASPEGPGGSEGGEGGSAEGEGSGEGQGADPEPEGPEVPEAVRERIEGYEEQLVEAGLLDEDDIPEWDEAEADASEEEMPEQVEKRFAAIEKALDGEGGRQGTASLLDGEGGRVAKNAPNNQRKDVLGQVQQMQADGGN